MTSELRELLLTADYLGGLMPSFLETPASEEAQRLGFVETCRDEVTGRPWLRLTRVGRLNRDGILTEDRDREIARLRELCDQRAEQIALDAAEIQRLRVENERLQDRIVAMQGDPDTEEWAAELRSNRSDCRPDERGMI
jgi:hypothetical protein